MASYPYTSGQGALAQALTQLQKNFPAKVDADYLKRFAIAPSNESYIIAILRFLNLIDEDGARLDDNIKFFYGTEEAFKSGLEERLRDAYSHLFEEMGDNAMTAEKAPLVHWFRASDKTSELVGLRQASTFLTLAAFAGHGSIPAAKAQQARKPAEAKSAATKAPARPAATPKGNSKQSNEETKNPGGGVVKTNGSDVGLTVRIEVNLPPGGDAKTYDAIFASIKKHLMS